MHAAVIKIKDAVVITTMGYTVVTWLYCESWGPYIHQKAGDFLFRAPWCLLYATCREQNNKISHIGMANKVFGAINYKVIAITFSTALHRANVWTRVGLS